MSRDKATRPDSIERASHENFLVAKGMTRAAARLLLPANKNRKEIAELIKERLRQSPKRQ